MNTTAIAIAISLLVGGAVGTALTMSFTATTTGAAACPQVAAAQLCPVPPKAAEAQHFLDYRPLPTTGSRGF
jgi:pantothenate kinase type III